MIVLCLTACVAGAGLAAFGFWRLGREEDSFRSALLVFGGLGMAGAGASAVAALLVQRFVA